MATTYGITEKFGKDLAALLADKIKRIYPRFDSDSFTSQVEQAVAGKTYTQRVTLMAECLRVHLPGDYQESIHILTSILGEENPHGTGMFTYYYWILPIGKYIELYGTDNFDVSMDAIEEVTKRNTGEYAVRPFIRKDPEMALYRMRKWALSDNFHLRRLASEGLRPKLPWSAKLDTYIHNPGPVFEILEILKEDPVMFVKKSVGNHLTDWLKVNREPAVEVIRRWRQSDNKHTQWIIKRATRKISI